LVASDFRHIVRNRFSFSIDLGRNKAKQKIHGDDLSQLHKTKPIFAGLVHKLETWGLNLQEANF